jgi:catechol 2,3-dioxygenase-like lactoylglutathione lyase family enzyme
VVVRRVIVDHVDLVVSDLEQSRAFFEAVLAPLGFREIDRKGGSVGFGAEQLDDFGLFQGDEPTRRAHVAFVAEDRTAVDAFHAAALAAGARDNGQPGVYRQWSDRYYAAYVLDDEDNSLEAVFHSPEPITDAPERSAPA